MAKRKAGRQPGGQAPIGPDQIAKIRDDFLRRRPIVWTAKELGVHHSTIQHHLEASVLPDFAERSEEALNEELARIELVEREAWAGFERSRLMAEERTVKKTEYPGAEEEAKPLTAATEKTLRRHGSPAMEIQRIRKRIFRDGDIGWLELVKWCISERNRMFGRYAKDRTDSERNAAAQRGFELVVVKDREQASRAMLFEEYEKGLNGSAN